MGLPDRQRRTASGVAVELGDDDAGDLQQLVEALCHIDRVLTGHRVDDEQDLVGMNLVADLLELLHELFVDMQTAGGIQDHHVVAVVLRVTDSLLRDLDRILGTHFKDRHAGFLADDLQLVDRRRAVDIAGDQHGTVILRLEHFGELCRVGGFTGTLQAAHHNDRRRLGSKLQTGVFAAHQGGQLLVDDLDDHLRRGQAFHDVLTDRAFGHGFGEVLGNLVVDVRFEQRQSYLAHCLLDVVLRQLALAL